MKWNEEKVYYCRIPYINGDFAKYKEEIKKSKYYQLPTSGPPYYLTYFKNKECSHPC